ncbi:hypothetical protein PAL_GLEAN10007140 [Pteropus alecto]|uniref:Uncharacterized protein n=1 Tax=Pteropus alecto TaxID=9402 RepID=L5KBQ6_PTEAL|nr:hypothetical protein PAL_GLEAN10007140 [Pteropus alecto]
MSDRRSDPKPRIADPPPMSDRGSDSKPRIAAPTPTSDRRSDPKPLIVDRTPNLGLRLRSQCRITLRPQTSDRGSAPNLGSRIGP